MQLRIEENISIPAEAKVKELCRRKYGIISLFHADQVPEPFGGRVTNKKVNRIDLAYKRRTGAAPPSMAPTLLGQEGLDTEADA